MGQIDANMAVAQRMGSAFAVSEQTPSSDRNMTVHVQPGWLYDGVTFTQTTAQDSTALAVPAAFTRIDRIVANAASGVVSVVSGSESSAPAAPAIPTGYIPLARIAVPAGAQAIGNSMITDERAVWGSVLPLNYQEFTSTAGGTWTNQGGSSNSLVAIMGWGGGGGGSNTGGGAGAACSLVYFLLGNLSSAETVTIGTGGTPSSLATFGSTVCDGGNSAFGSRCTFYGGSLLYGAGVLGRAILTTTPVAGGPPNGGTGVNVTTSIFGGGSPNPFSIVTPGNSVWGGGSGGLTGGVSVPVAGRSFYGGGGGNGGSTASAPQGGVSVFGGNGGNGSTLATGTGTSGSSPGGGGGQNAAGGKGAVRVWVFRG